MEVQSKLQIQKIQIWGKERKPSSYAMSFPSACMVLCYDMFRDPFTKGIISSQTWHKRNSSTIKEWWKVGATYQLPTTYQFDRGMTFSNICETLIDLKKMFMQGTYLGDMVLHLMKLWIFSKRYQRHWRTTRTKQILMVVRGKCHFHYDAFII